MATRRAASVLSWVAAVALSACGDAERGVEPLLRPPVAPSASAGMAAPLPVEPVLALAGGVAASVPSSSPIAPPWPAGCIADTRPGDHRFVCDGVTYLVVVDEVCTRLACGLIVDIHGDGMGGEQMRDATLLHELAPPRGYLVVHPSATPEASGGHWAQTDHERIGDFMLQLIDVFQVDPDRIHVTGFARGGELAWALACTQAPLVAGAAPVAGAPDMTGAAGCFGAAAWPTPSLLYPSLLYMNGEADPSMPLDRARALIGGLAERMGMGGSRVVAADDGFSRQAWSAAGGLELEYIEHRYAIDLEGGHCIPGGRDLPRPGLGLRRPTTCTRGSIALRWGEVALQWFVDHPRR